MGGKIDKEMYVKLGKQLKKARMEKGYSLAEVGRLLGRADMTIKRYEEAKSRIDINTLQRLCAILGIDDFDYTYIYGGQVEPRTSVKDDVYYRLINASPQTKITVLTLLGYDNAIELAESLE